MELDEAGITESVVDGEADVLRAVVADLELEEDAAAQAGVTAQPEASTTGRTGLVLGFTGSHMETVKLLLSGGIAGAVSKSCTAPLARLTILYQVDGLHLAPTAASIKAHAPAARMGVWAALRHVVAQEGVRALWKGNGVTIIHRLPYSAANFWTYEQVNEVWKHYLPPDPASSDLSDVLRRLVSGGVAGMTACALAYPLDLVRTRLAAQTSQRYYRGIGHALATIVRDEGAAGLYRGLGATLLQVAPSLAINYACYETLRSQWLERTGSTTPTVPMSLACGSLAGLVSSTVTFPLDLVRRRMQLVGQGGGRRTSCSASSSSAASGTAAGPKGGTPATTASASSSSSSSSLYRGVFRDIWQKEGLRGLYAGILPEYYKVVPGVAIAFCTYELMKRSLGVQTNATKR